MKRLQQCTLVTAMLTLTGACAGDERTSDASLKVDIEAPQASVSALKTRPQKDSIPSMTNDEDPARSLQAAAELEQLVQRITALPEITKPRLEKVLRAKLQPSDALLTPATIHAGTLDTGPFDHVELRQLPQHPTAVFVVLSVRRTPAIPFAALRDKLSKAAPIMSSAQSPDRSITFQSQDASGYVITHSFETESKRLTTVSIARAESPS